MLTDEDYLASQLQLTSKASEPVKQDKNTN